MLKFEKIYKILEKQIFTNYQYLLAVASGIFLFFSFPKFGNKIFAWFSFLPLIFSFLLISNVKKVIILSFITGVIGYCGILYWIVPTFVVAGEHWIFGLISTVLLSLYCSFYIAVFCLFIYFYKQISKLNIFFLISSSSLWVILEYIRSVLFTGFPWALLGYSQYDNLPLIQISEYSGVYGISFVVIFVNLAVAVIIFNSVVEKQSVLQIFKNVFILVCFYIVLHIYGSNVLKTVWKNVNNTDKETYNVILLQGNIDQYKKWDQQYKLEIMQKYSNLVLKSCNNIDEKNYSCIFIWPESSVPGWLFEEKFLFDWVLSLVRLTNINFRSYHLIGTVRMGKSYNEYYNSAVLFSFKEGKINFDKIYDKIHLVPFGEYVPLRRILKKFIKTVNELGEFTAGKDYTVFEIDKTIKFSVLICYESIFPELTSRFVRKGANFLANITNDAWFLKTSAPYQHFIFNIFRAVENRCFLFRAANTGISAVISPTGEVLNKTNLFEDASLITQTNFYHKKTFYTKFAEWLWIFYFVLFLLPLGLQMKEIKNKLKVKQQNETSNLNTKLPVTSILYVCSGNVFRSVFAEGYTKHLLAKYGVDNIEVKSCGIIAQKSFKIPKCIYKFFELYDIKEKDLSTHIPTKINEELLKTADIILVMDKSQLEFIKENFDEYFSKTFLLKEYAGFFTNPEIYDPLGQPESVYLKTVEEIKLCVEIILKNFVKNYK